jgi:hypothetical protein
MLFAGAMLANSEQRRHSRFDGARLSALLTFDGAAHPEAHIVNVSLGGALVTLACAPPARKQVQLALWRMGRRALKHVGRIVAVVPPCEGHPLPGVRIVFNATSVGVNAQLYDMIRDLPFEIGERDILRAAHSAPGDDDEPIFDLVDVVDEDEAVSRMALEEELLSKQLRIEDLERQLRRLRRRARPLEALLIPAVLAS